MFSSENRCACVVSLIVVLAVNESLTCHFYLLSGETLFL